MKISVEEVSRLLAHPSVERTSRTVNDTTSGSVASPAASVQLSATAQDIQQVKRIINQLPDERADRVAALKAQVESGTYRVSGEDIADLIIRRALADNTAL